MRIKKVGLAMVFVNAWVFVLVGAAAGLSVLGERLSASGLVSSAALDDWWFVGWPGVFVTPALLLVTALVLDYLGSPAWHRAWAVPALLLETVAFRWPALQLRNSDSIALCWVLMSVSLSVAVLLLTLQLSGWMRRAGERTPDWLRYGSAALLVLAYVGWAVPDVYVAPGPLPTGDYAHQALLDPRLSAGSLRATVPDERVGHRSHYITTDAQSVFRVEGRRVSADEFVKLVESDSPEVDLSLESTGVARILTIRE